MTDSEINEACARKLGWEYKMAVANQPMSLSWVRDGWTNGQTLPDYCHSIEAAWEIVEHKAVIDEWWCFTVHAYLGGWVAGWTDRNDTWMNKTNADTAPMAICLAFLKLNDSQV